MNIAYGQHVNAINTIQERIHSVSEWSKLYTDTFKHQEIADFSVANEHKTLITVIMAYYVSVYTTE